MLTLGVKDKTKQSAKDKTKQSASALTFSYDTDRDDDELYYH